MGSDREFLGVVTSSNDEEYGYLKRQLGGNDAPLL